VSGGALFAGTEGDGVFLSANNGTRWTAANSGLRIYSDVEALAASGSTLFAGTSINGVYLSTDNGASWATANSGLTDSAVLSLAVSGGTLFAGTYGGGVWSRPIAQMGVLNPKSQRAVSTRSNFNVLLPSRTDADATIEFSLPHADKVTVTIYDLSGHEIVSLVNKNLGQGSHSIQWNTRNLAAGCYMVRFQAGANTNVKSVPIFR
jgi:hypothetical protein